MKGDFSRFSFDSKKHYRAVLMQQGRLQLDSDWNEQVQIIEHRYNAFFRSMVGRSGTPKDARMKLLPPLILANSVLGSRAQDTSSDIKLVSPASDLESKLQDTSSGSDLKKVSSILGTVSGVNPSSGSDITQVSSGSGLTHLTHESLGSHNTHELSGFDSTQVSVDLGHASDVHFTDPASAVLRNSFQLTKGVYYIDGLFIENDAAIALNLPQAAGEYLCYLDAWTREVSAAEDASLIDPGIGLETTARLKTEWKVRYQSADQSIKDNLDKFGIGEWPINEKLTGDWWRGLSTGKLKLDKLNVDFNDNRLYRVEVHDDGSGTRFKWSADNASVCAEATAADAENTYKLTNNGANIEDAFRGAAWIELCVPGETGLLLDTSASGVRFENGVLSFPSGAGYAFARMGEKNFIIRRWDGVFTEKDTGKDNSLTRELGVAFVAESGKFYRSGDYWLILIREGKIENWKTNESKLPDGVEHHFAALGIIKIAGTGTEEISKELHWDFPSLTDREFSTVNGAEIGGDLHVKGKLTVDKTTTIGTSGTGPFTTSLTVNGEAKILGRTITGTPGAVTSSLEVNGNTTITGTATITGNVTIGGTSNITGDTTINQDLLVKRKLTVDKATTLNDALTVNSTTNITGNTTIGTPPYFNNAEIVLTLLGEQVMQIRQGTPYVEPGFTAISKVGGDITNKVKIIGSVNINNPGTYSLEYSVTDQDENRAATATRFVEVVEASLPLGGKSNLTVCYDTTIYGDTTIGAGVSINGNKLTVNGATYLNGDTTISRNLTIGGTLILPEPASAPVISGFFPLKAQHGDYLTICGGNFSTIAANNKVKFNNKVIATVIAATATQLIVAVPEGDSCSGKITVTVGNKNATSAAEFNYVRTIPGSIIMFSRGESTKPFSHPQGIAVDDVGNMYVADTFNHRICKVTAKGDASTLVSGGDYSTFRSPEDIAIDVFGNIYFTAQVRICKVTANGDVSTFVSSGGSSVLSGDPKGLAVDLFGNLYVTMGNSVIFKVTPSGHASIFTTGNPDSFSNPVGLTIDAFGNLYLADANRIFHVTPDGQSRILARGDSTHIFSRLWGITIDAVGNLYASDYNRNCIYKVTPGQDGQVSTVVAGDGSTTTLNMPMGITINPSGTAIYVLDCGSSCIRKIELK